MKNPTESTVTTPASRKLVTLRDKMLKHSWQDDMVGPDLVRVDDALSALRQWLADEGLVVVPREPSDAMAEAGWSVRGTQFEPTPDAQEIYRAMIAAGAAQSALDEASKGDAVDTVTMDVPLLLRMLEYAREDAQEDMDLHTVAEKMIELAKMDTLTMDHYDAVVMGDDQTQQVDESHAHAVDDDAAHERVTYSKTKTVGDADVTVSANAGSLEELQYILKLAGLPADHLAVQPSAVEIVPQVHSEPVHSEPAEPCGCDATTSYEYDKDVKYSTDKQTLMNYLKDQLNKRID
jgi:hypothetical protein